MTISKPIAALVPVAATAHNLGLDRAFQQHHMNLKTWKLIKALLVSLGVFGVSVFSILQGADPTVTAVVAIATVALLNGIEAAELAAAMAEVQAGRGGSTSDGGSDDER